MTESKKEKSQKGPSRRFDWKLFQHPLPVGLALTAAGALSTVAVYEYQRPAPSLEEVLTKVPEMAQPYSVSVGGRTLSGESVAPFEKGAGYFARVEGCERFGVEGVFSISSCLMTLKLVNNMTVSNSENLTEARYDDGSPAPICCLIVNDDYEAPIYKIRLPDGSLVRRTYSRGEEIHILLNIPNDDPARNLDAIKFSPGEGVNPILFSVRDKMKDKTFTRAFIEANKGNPQMDQIVADAHKMKSRLAGSKEAYRGLTY